VLVCVCVCEREKDKERARFSASFCARVQPFFFFFNSLIKLAPANLWGGVWGVVLLGGGGVVFFFFELVE